MTVFAAVVFAFLFWIAASNGAPWYIWAVWSVSAAMLAYMLIANPLSGVALTETHLTHWAGSKRATYAFADIDHVHFEDWSDSTDTVVVLRDGSLDRLFSGSVPGGTVMDRELTQRGVRVTRT